MYCRYCGKETEDGSRYCNACGRFLGDGGAKSRSVPKLGKAVKAICAASIAFVVVLVAAAVLLATENKEEGVGKAPESEAVSAPAKPTKKAQKEKRKKSVSAPEKPADPYEEVLSQYLQAAKEDFYNEEIAAGTSLETLSCGEYVSQWALAERVRLQKIVDLCYAYADIDGNKTPELLLALKEGEQIFIYDVFAASSGQAVRLFEENKFGRHCSLKLYVTGVLEAYTDYIGNKHEYYRIRDDGCTLEFLESISYSLAEGVANSDAGILFYHDQGEQEEINVERFNEIWDSYAGQEELHVDGWMIPGQEGQPDPAVETSIRDLLVNSEWQIGFGAQDGQYIGPRDMYGFMAMDYGSEMSFGEDGSFSYYVGAAGGDGLYELNGEKITVTYQRVGDGGAAEQMDYCRKKDPEGVERDCVHYMDLGGIDVYFEKK